MLYEVAYYSDFIYINVYSSYVADLIMLLVSFPFHSV
jgi:hypothetical protein